MSFNRYQAKKYIEYLDTHKKVLSDIYKLLTNSEQPYTYTRLGKLLKYDYYQMHRRIKNQSFTTDELIKLLNFLQ